MYMLWRIYTQCDVKLGGTWVADHHMICDFAGRMVTKTIGELYEGATFGDLALIHKTKRSASIVCKGHVQFQNELLF